MRGSGFIFDSVQMLYYKCDKVSFKHGSSYIDSPDQIRLKKATKVPKYRNDKCFQYVVTVTLNGEQNIIILQKQMTGKRLRKVIQQLALIFCILKKINMSNLYLKI